MESLRMSSIKPRCSGSSQCPSCHRLLRGMLGWGVMLLLGLNLSAQAKTWHVSPETIAGVPGDSQIRTIGAAIKQLTPGDTVLIHAGIYREALALRPSGRPNRPIVLKAVAGDHVVVTGADHIRGWTSVPGEKPLFWSHWPHRFITWSKHNTHPDDDYHRLIGRSEQVFINGYALNQVLRREQMGRGTFFVDLPAQRLYVRPANGVDPNSQKSLVESSVRDRILVVEGNHVHIEGIRFRYAANRAHSFSSHRRSR